MLKSHPKKSKNLHNYLGADFSNFLGLKRIYKCQEKNIGFSPIYLKLGNAIFFINSIRYLQDFIYTYNIKNLKIRPRDLKNNFLSPRLKLAFLLFSKMF